MENDNTFFSLSMPGIGTTKEQTKTLMKLVRNEKILQAQKIILLIIERAKKDALQSNPCQK